MKNYRSQADEHVRYQTEISEPSMTKQSFKEEADINTILKKHGVIPPDETRAGTYGICTGITYQQSLNIVRQADEAFELLPSSLRSRFENNPQKMLEFLDDASNAEEAIKLGLVNAPVEVPPGPTEEAPVTP